MDDKEFLELLDFRGKTLNESIEQLEKLLTFDRPEMIVYRPELESKLAELKEIRDYYRKNAAGNV